MIKVKEMRAFYPPGHLPPQSNRPEGAESREGPIPQPNMTNESIESHRAREGLLPGQGLMCIRVMPGEKLGEVLVNIQYEGPIDTGHGEPNLCMAGQNSTLMEVSNFLQQLLGDAKGCWDVFIDSEPCPKAALPPRLQEAKARLEGVSTSNRHKRDEHRGHERGV